MGDDSFILMNLKDSKEIASAMQNETAQKILDYLTKGKATESKIAEELKIPISTVHYNLQLLKKAKLVKADEYHYSKKGKEVLHYKLAKKLIIIAPGDENNWKDLLKKVIPALGIVAIGGYLVKFFGKSKMIATDLAAPMVRSVPQMEQEVPAAVADSGVVAVSGGADVVSNAFAAGAEKVVTNVTENVTQNLTTNNSVPQMTTEPSFWQSLGNFEWFLIGAISFIAILLIIELFAHNQWFKSKKR